VTELQMCFQFDLCMPSYSGRSNGVPFVQRFLCTTYRFAVTRLGSHSPTPFSMTLRIQIG